MLQNTIHRPAARMALATLTAAALLAACGGGSEPAHDSPAAQAVAQACPLPEPVLLHVNTQDAAPILDRENYVRAALQLPAADAADQAQELSVRIRGRGNSTWTAMKKKPYKLKLDDRVGLLGLPAGKDWALLANHADKTLLRNELAFCMARAQGMPYTPDSRFFELNLNGSYDGVYQLTHKTYPVEDRIKADAKPGSGAPDDSVDAFLLELDFAHRKNDWIQTQSGLYYNIRFDSDAEQMLRITDWMNSLEALIADRSDPERLQKVGAVMDLASLADLFLVNELAANPDGWLSSMYLYRLQGGLLTFGPVWDFDQAFGPTVHNLNPEGWLHINRDPYDQYNGYFRELMTEPGFADIVRQRWQHLAALVPHLVEHLHQSAAALDAAQQRNFQRWPILDEPIFTNVFALGSYTAEVDYVAQWLSQRARWIDANFESFLAAF